MRKRVTAQVDSSLSGQDGDRIEDRVRPGEISMIFPLLLSFMDSCSNFYVDQFPISVLRG